MRKRVFWWGVGLFAVLSAIRGGTALYPPPWVSQYLAAVESTAERERQAITVGHSSSRAIDFSVLGLSGQHLFRSGNDLFETAYLFSAILPRVPNLEYVFLPLSPFDFLRNGAEGDPRHYLETYSLGRWLGGKGTIAGDRQYASLSALWSLSSRDLRSYLDPSRYGPTRGPLAADSGSLASRPNPKSEVSLRVSRLFAQSVLSWSRDPTLNKRAVDAVSAMDREMKRQGIMPVFFRSPFPELTMTTLKDKGEKGGIDILRLYEESIRDLQRQGVCVLDPLVGSNIPQDLDLFFDYSHLNQEGARRFSQRLRGLLTNPALGLQGCPPVPRSSARLIHG